MYLGENLQFLRKMHNGMTQEELAEKMGVSRQTISKWELNTAYPEMDKAMELCQYFSCSMDQLLRENMNMCSEAYSDIRIEEVESFRYISYAVISRNPESDAINCIKNLAFSYGVKEPEIIGWDFPHVSQEQINVFHMHGYAAALILPSDVEITDDWLEVITQIKQKYAKITIKEYLKAPFNIIPNAYKVLMSYIQVNGYKNKYDKDYLSCFEKEYVIDGTDYMDIFIAIE